MTNDYLLQWKNKSGLYLSHWNGAAGFPQWAKIWTAGVNTTRKMGAITCLEKSLMRDQVWDSGFFDCAGCCCCLIFFSIGAGAGATVFFLLCLRAITHPRITWYSRLRRHLAVGYGLHNKFLQIIETKDSWCYLRDFFFAVRQNSVELIQFSE